MPKGFSVSSKPHVVILGAGPAGLSAALGLARAGNARVTVLEKSPHVGGNAGSFELAGQWVDYGSHRLHPACDPAILDDIRSLLGPDLLDMPRHGRIRLKNRWLHFPLKPLDLAVHLPPRFAVNAAADTARRFLRHDAASAEDSFATVLEASLGATMCREFYFPYATKLWGLSPEQLSAVQAARRVSANSPAKMIRKLFSALPAFRRARGSGRFYYPRKGFGQISAAYHSAAQAGGVEFRLGVDVKSVSLGDGGNGMVSYGADGTESALQANYIWSTIPVTTFARLLTSAPPAHTMQAASKIDFRAMILIYLVLEQDRFEEYDAHYFPETGVAISRMSEPKNYSASNEPRGLTVLCGELPCSPDDALWDKGDRELGQLMCQSLEKVGLGIRAPVRQVITRRIRHAYPIYRRGYEQSFEQLDQWINQTGTLLTFGRQGLFVHDNTHHALFMGRSAANCLEQDGQFNRERWIAYRRVFETHVVED